ncbi:MAG: hypothetical protein QM223_01765, partial [Bacteroidota bacterium]|nr:hypothetical protein [Bacteroidota bacterium]
LHSVFGIAHANSQQAPSIHLIKTSLRIPLPLLTPLYYFFNITHRMIWMHFVLTAIYDKDAVMMTGLRRW